MNQAAAVQTGAAVQAQPTSLRKLLGMGQGQIGDGFAMIFQQMLGDGDEEQLSALLMQMAGSLQEDSEELEARSQELKLRQKCMDIAALMMVEELEDGEEE